MFKAFLLSAIVAGSIVVTGCEDDPVVTPPQATAGSDTLTGNLTADRTLSKDTLYTLKGFFFIQPGVKLTIPAGTKIQGLFGTTAALVAVRGDGTKPSGQLIANGTAAAPIIFTSSQPEGQRKRGDWGGVVLNGMADLNVPGKNGTAEGGVGSYGPGANTAKNDDNSGVLRYVRIEYGGTKVTADNEINGLTLNAVGSGTTIEYVQTHMIADDGFEWFGGTVNAKYLVSSGNDDDAFDMDFGYSGKLQFLFAMQDPDLANRGFEIDNDANSSTNTPYTGAVVSNVTLVGTGKAKANNENNDGLYLRRNNRLKIYNLLMTNFGGYGLVVDGSSTKANAQNGELFVKNSVISGAKGSYAYAYQITDPNDATKKITVFSADSLSASVTANNWNISSDAVTLAGISFDAPNPLPTGAINVTPANVGDAFFTPTTYIGAFGTTNWLTGWTNFKKS